MGDNLWDEDVVDEVGRFLRHVNLASSSSNGADGVTKGTTARGSVKNAVMAQRLSEALASRAKRISERRAGGGAGGAEVGGRGMGSIGVFAKKSEGPSAVPPSVVSGAVSGASGSTSTTPNVAGMPPTPPPTPTLEAARHYHPGDGFGGDGEYGGAGRNSWWGDEEEEEEEWVTDETPFGRKARENGLKFVGGKEDGESLHLTSCFLLGRFTSLI